MRITCRSECVKGVAAESDRVNQRKGSQGNMPESTSLIELLMEGRRHPSLLVSCWSRENREPLQWSEGATQIHIKQASSRDRVALHTVIAFIHGSLLASSATMPDSLQLHIIPAAEEQDRPEGG